MKNQLNVWVYFYSLMYMVLLMLIPHCFDYPYSLVTLSLVKFGFTNKVLPFWGLY